MSLVLTDFSRGTHAVNGSVPAQAGIGLRLIHDSKVLSGFLYCFGSRHMPRVS